MKDIIEKTLFETKPSLDVNCFYDLSQESNNPIFLSNAEYEFFENVQREFGKTFTNDQKRAILSNGANLLIEAGAGSGKTTVIVYKIKYLIEELGVAPERIVLVTFTDEASKVMKERLLSVCRFAGRVSVSTFHSLFGKELSAYMKKPVFQNLIKGYDQDNMFKLAMKECQINPRSVELKDLKKQVTFWKNELIQPSDIEPSHDYYGIYQAYESLKEKEGKVDFDDIQIKFLDILESDEFFRLECQFKYDYIDIDELQDINKAQIEIIKLMKGPKTLLHVVGDPRQAIYGFRGSNSKYILTFEKLFNANRVSLDINFRSTDAIVQIANNVISNNHNIKANPMKSVNKAEYFPTFNQFGDDRAEAQFIAGCISVLRDKENHDLNEIAILLRNGFYADIIVHQLSESKIPFVISQDIDSIYRRPAIKGMLGVMKMIDDPNNLDAIRDFSSWLYISNSEFMKLKNLHETTGKSCLECLIDLEYKFNKQNVEDFLYHFSFIKGATDRPFEFANMFIDRFLRSLWYNKGIQGKLQLEDLEVFTSVIERMSSYGEVFTRVTDSENELKNAKKVTDGVRITTSHGSKGLEWDTVFVPGHIDGFLPSKKSMDLEEERNVEYVALTRARKRLIPTGPANHNYSDTNTVSAYVKEMKLNNLSLTNSPKVFR